jgi:hypothetical protein
MLLLTEDADLKCLHHGNVSVAPTQSLVTIERRRVLVEPNPEGRNISLCPNMGALIKPCNHTLKVQSGYSPLLVIEGHRVCLDSIRGLTDGTPPGIVEYRVFDPGQPFVHEEGGG